jgi:exopolysaccharide production protein ExoQ
MPPLLALLICLAAVFWLVRKDMEWRQLNSSALFIPGLWIAIIASRPLSNWFDSGAGENSLEGRPINTAIFAFLIASAFVILSRRRFDWGDFLQRNKALLLVYSYFALSSLWSEQSLVSLKRVGKDFGCVLAALVLLTEARPAAAVRGVCVRVAYVLIPLSLVFGKYFPNLGRNYSPSGEPMFTGVTTQKNSLGQLVLALGLILFWDYLHLRSNILADPVRAKQQRWIHIGTLILAGWLLVASDSQTSLLCFILGLFALWGVGRLLRLPNGKAILVFSLVAVLCLSALDKTFGLSDVVIRGLGRNPTLTGRTDIWRIVLDQKTNRLIGEGFNIFWDSAKGHAVQLAVRAPIQSSHNGYLEMYLDGGLIGIAVLGIFLLSCGRRAIARTFQGASFGRIGFVCWIVTVIYNLSESSFLRLDILWFSLLLFTIDYRERDWSRSPWLPAYEDAPVRV